MKRLLPLGSMEKPRPPSAGLNHHPVCGGRGSQATPPSIASARWFTPLAIICCALVP